MTSAREIGRRAVIAAFTLLFGAVFALAAAAQPVLTHSGSANAVGGTSRTISITANAGDVIYLFTMAENPGTGDPGALAISGCGLTWTTRQALVWSGNGGAFTSRNAVFVARTAGALAGCTATITSVGGIDCASTVYGAFSGVDPAIYDNSPSLPGTASSLSPTAVTPTISTRQANDVLLAWFDGGGSGTFGSGTLPGYTLVAQIFNSGFVQLFSGVSLFYRPVTVTQTNVTATSSQSSGSAGWRSGADALTADVPTALASDTLMMSGFPP